MTISLNFDLMGQNIPSSLWNCTVSKKKKEEKGKKKKTGEKYKC